MKQLTVDDVMAMEPCSGPSGYPRERVVALWAGREALSAREIGDLDILGADRVWVLVRMLPERDARLWACDTTEAALAAHWTSDDRSPHEAVRVARLFAVGEATLEEMDAAHGAAWDAAWSASWAFGAKAAARAAVWASVRDVVEAATVAAGWAAQAAAEPGSRGSWGSARVAQIKSLIARIEGLSP